MRALQKNIEIILETYTGEIPLTHFLKNYYKSHPILGSRDRKIISDAVYSFYRCVKFLKPTVPLWNKVLISIALCENEHAHTLKLLPPAMQILREADTGLKLRMLTAEGLLDEEQEFPLYSVPFSNDISHTSWYYSLWQKPRVFFSITRKKEKEAIQLLTSAGIEFRSEYNGCFSCEANTPIEKILQPNSYRIQDLSSRETASFYALRPGCSVWDCCSGAGGKSLLASDKEPGIHLTVSDIRPSILHNLQERFKLYKKPAPEQILVSAADEQALSNSLGNRRFDQVIADVPCSGSGTWARTPEQFYFFRQDAITGYSSRQRQILQNISFYVQPGGHLTYITCSVFREENESVIEDFLAQHNEFELIRSATINGIAHKADCMFAALMQRKA